MPERRGSTCTNPLAATGVAFLLLFKTLFEFLQQFFQPPERFNLLFVLFRQVFLEFQPQPVLWNQSFYKFVEGLKVFKVRTECLVESIEQLFIFHQTQAGEMIKIIHGSKYQALLHRFEENQKLPGRNWESSPFQPKKEIDQHIVFSAPRVVKGMLIAGACGRPAHSSAVRHRVEESPCSYHGFSGCLLEFRRPSTTSTSRSIPRSTAFS